MRVGFFPLDDHLALLPGRFTPHIQEVMVRFGAWMPFDQAARILDQVLGVLVTADSVRRHTETAGTAFVALQTAGTEHLLQGGATDTPPGEHRLVVSADGAMVPLRHGVWAEVKTLAVGEVTDDGTTSNLSYFSRLCDAATFTEQATIETVRRGVCHAAQVAAVVDGAEWLQGFLDVQCPQALRILDFPHAAQRVSQIGQALFGSEDAERQAWVTRQLHMLQHEGPQRVLAAIHEKVGDEQVRQEAIAEDVGYLEKRVGHMDYVAYRKAGWPIGSGSVESANKLVVEARLKGAGMHWAREHVDGMVALRTVVCSGRWEEAWPMMHKQQREDERAGRAARRKRRRVRGAEGYGEDVMEREAQPCLSADILAAYRAQEEAEVRTDVWRHGWIAKRCVQQAAQSDDARL